jgi:hypothetical protein
VSGTHLKLLNKEETSDVDLYFWVGSFVDLLLLIVLVYLIKAIRNQTKIIKDL